VVGVQQLERRLPFLDSGATKEDEEELSYYVL
jgi:hypothetical protein